MYNLDKWKDRLIKDIGKKRFDHSLRVMETALKLNLSLNLNIDIDKLKTAAILHDAAKYNEDKYIKEFDLKLNQDILSNKEVMHAFIGAEVAKKVYNIKDREVLRAIKYHTTGRDNMSDLMKVIFIADAIEPKRDYPNVEEIRDLAFKNLDDGILLCLNHNIKYLIEKDVYIHPLTLKARNYLIKEQNE